ncbi:MAG: nickel pincer cofactor biosynthesis protein LarC [Pirellulaceae bacterium]|nr:nickel pincer cofactor biosynthesis protein LarC [Planctomycetales bacterium]MCA9224700.1 nickel pincer cofactor biosynthesis protein LarC [Planctomycetales bacterium]
MKIAYFDCISGISGDMTLGALADVGVPLDQIQQAIDSLGLPSCRLASTEVKKNGFRATKVSVEHEPEHAHRHLHHITDMIDASQLTPAQKELAKRIFTRLGEAEAKVHGSTLRKVHFHEVGAVDSIADIVGAAVGLDLLGVDRIYCSPVPTGHGFVKIAHGRVSIPAPATAELLRGIPLAAAEAEAELTTPTGAAIVATVVDQFGPLPSMKIDNIGYGAGDRDLPNQPNILRLMIGEATDDRGADQVWVLETNLDDVTGELIGHCTTLLFDAGALDVYTTAIQMKKNRPGVKLTVLCQADRLAKLERIIFRETATLGIRRWLASRHKLERRPHTVETTWGAVEGKLALLGDDSVSFSPEFESCRRIAEQHQVPLKDVYEAARSAFSG